MGEPIRHAFDRLDGARERLRAVRVDELFADLALGPGRADEQPAWSS